MNLRVKLLGRVLLWTLYAAVPIGAHAESEERTVTLPLVLAADGRATGLVRVVNRSDAAGTVEINGVDDAGGRFGPVTLSLHAGHAVQLSSEHLEQGSAERGLPEGLGDGRGHWRLVLASTLDIAAGAYVRTRDGLLAAVHDRVAEGGPMQYHVPWFNPAGKGGRSMLRIANASDARTRVAIEGVDDLGEPGERTVRLTLRPREAVMLSAGELEEGTHGLSGYLGEGHGKWRLNVSADQPIEVMNLLRQRRGHWSNLSTVASAPDVVLHYVGCDAPEGFHGYLARGAAQAGADLGVDVSYVFPTGELTIEKQVALIDAAIAAEVDGIAICTYAEDDAYRAVASRAHEAGVAIGSAAAPPSGTRMRDSHDMFLFRVGSDEDAAGTLTARRLIALGVTGPVLVVNQVPHDTTCRERVRAQREVLAKTNIETRLLEAAMPVPEQETRAILAHLERHPDTQAATSVCRPIDGLLAAKEQSARADLILSGYDLIGRTVAAIRDGQQAFSIDQQPFWRGYVPILLLTHYVQYGQVQANYFFHRAGTRRCVECRAGGGAIGEGYH